MNRIGNTSQVRQFPVLNKAFSSIQVYAEIRTDRLTPGARQLHRNGVYLYRVNEKEHSTMMMLTHITYNLIKITFGTTYYSL